jgi:hypothetical protein
MGRRRAKTKKVTLDSSSDDSSDDGDDSTNGEKKKTKNKSCKRAVAAGEAVDVDVVSNEVMKRPRNAGNCVSAFECSSAKGDGVEDDDDNEDEQSIIPDNDLSFDVQAPFCCATCHCPKQVVEKLQLADEEFFQPGEGARWHRRCCHGHHLEHKKACMLEYWATSFLAAQEQGEMYFYQQAGAAAEPSSSSSSSPAVAAAARKDDENDQHRPNTNPLHFDWITKRELQNQYNVARSQQAEMYNDDGWESKSHARRIAHGCGIHSLRWS